MKPSNKDSCSLMSWTKSGRKDFKEPPSFNNKEKNGMTSISKRKNFNKEIGPCCMIADSRTSKES
jgi:hypothetical protein